MIVGIVLGLAALVVIGAVVRSRRGVGDGVASFQRQIDALSHEARRPVVDQVHRAASDDEEVIEEDDGQPDTDRPDVERDDEDGKR